MPSDVKVISGDSPVGQALLNWKRGEDRLRSENSSRGVFFDFLIIDNTACNMHIPEAIKKQNQSISGKLTIDDAVDNSKHANGHLAREVNHFGMYPMHDFYGDESTGEERDFEDYAEYSANYAE